MATEHSTKAARRRQAVPHFTLCEKTGRYLARRALTEDQIIKAALRLLETRLFREHGPLTSTATAGNFMVAHFARHEREVFACLWLDNGHRPLAFEELFFGTIGTAAVYPREITKAALRHNAAAVILCHNHPSGTLDPSPADIHITARIERALELVEVRTLDHFIVGGGQFLSFVERGLMHQGETPDSPDQ